MSEKQPNHPMSSVHLDGFAPAAAVASSASPPTTTETKPDVPDAATQAASASSSPKKRTRDSTASSTAVTSSATTRKKSTKNKNSKITNHGNNSNSSGSNSHASSNNNKNNHHHHDLNETETINNDTTTVSSEFQPMTLQEIQSRIQALMDKLPNQLPPVPEEKMIHFDEHENGNGNGNGNIIQNPQQNTNNNHNEKHDDNKNRRSSNHHNQQHYPAIQSFASHLQTTIESFNLLLSLVSSATYTWGVDRSGASQQNLAVMSAELQQCQEVIGSVVSSRLSNVLCPSVDIVVGRVDIVRENNSKSGKEGEGGNEKHILGEDMDDTTTCNLAKKRKLNNSNSNSNSNNATTTRETRTNHYIRPYVDPNYVHLCHVILARNASMIRHVVASCLHSAQKVIGDYLKAAKKDVNHSDSGRGYAF